MTYVIRLVDTSQGTPIMREWELSEEQFEMFTSMFEECELISFGESHPTTERRQ